MKMFPSIIVLAISTVTCGHPAIPDKEESREEDVPGMKHRQVRGMSLEDQRRLVGKFSTRPFYDTTKPKKEFENFYWTDSYLLNAYGTSFDDPFWQYQWYQHDRRTSAGPVMDHNIVPVQRKGYNGKGISIGILGQSLDRELFDMKDRVEEIFFAMGTSTSGQEENDSQPTFSHMASMAAGVIAMNANNSLCGSGIAYNAKVTGITVMDDSDENDKDYIIKGMMHKLGELSIYVDAIPGVHDGTTMPTSKRVKNSLAEIATKGRGKKGGIYVMGSGNGGEQEDNCGADYIVNSIHTFVIGSVNNYGAHPKYSETCSAIIAAAYSSGDLSADLFTKSTSIIRPSMGIVTINDTKSCTRNFGGTSASAAIASGIFALTLQANPNLSWRDLMHIIVWSSERAPLYSTHGWKINGAGFYVSHEFGFGLLNAENMVLTSQKWERVPKMITCKLKFEDLGDIRKFGGVNATLEVDDCPSLEDDSESVKYIEQVELVTTVSFYRKQRGDLSISLTSPSKTKSVLLRERSRDWSKKGLKDWSMRSLHFWGEQPSGTWQLKMDLSCLSQSHRTLTRMIFRLSHMMIGIGHSGDKVHSVELVIHGTSDVPKHYDQRRTYSYAPEDKWTFAF